MRRRFSMLGRGRVSAITTPHSLACAPSTVNHQRAAGDHGRFIGGQIQRRRNHLLGSYHPPLQLSRGHLPIRLFGIGMLLEQLLHKWRLHSSGTNAVEPHPGVRMIQRQRLRQPHHREFRRRVSLYNLRYSKAIYKICGWRRVLCRCSTWPRQMTCQRSARGNGGRFRFGALPKEARPPCRAQTGPARTLVLKNI